jgi:radical SAM protein with 4Fe4S-binding SPASM domain
MIAYAKRWGIVTFTSTNGHLLADPTRTELLIAAGLDHLIVSVDGATPETYVRYRRGGDLNTVLQGIQCAVSIRQKLERSFPLIELQFLVMRHNEHEMSRIREIARTLNVDRLSFKTVQIENADQSGIFLPSDPRLSRYEHIGGELRMEQRRDFGSRAIRAYAGCRRLWYSTVVNWDGSISPCCFDKDGVFVMGNVLEEPFEKIWWGKRYHRFRWMVLQDRDAIPICRNCTEGLARLYIRGRGV